MARKQILAPVILPLLLAGFLAHSVVPLARVATTYQALAIGLGPEMIGLLSAVFALLPVFLAVLVGRFNDRGGAGWSAVLGASAIAFGSLVLWSAQTSLAGLLAGTAILGIGQSMLMTALQLVTSRVSSRSHRDAVLGNYMMAMSLGQSVGPLMVGVTTDHGVLLAICLLCSLLLVGFAIRIKAAARRSIAGHEATSVTLREIAGTRGLPWIIVIGSLCLTAQDLLLTFLPLLGVERGITPAVIGILLSLRALSAMVSRVFYGRSAKYLGRLKLLLIASSAGGIGLVSIALPLPIWAMGLSMIVAGFGLGITLTCAIALTLSIAPPSARGTALSLRMTVNRLVQFGVPLVSGFVLSPLGATGIFALAGTAILGLVVARPRGITNSR